jgi:hypothetical protein
MFVLGILAHVLGRTASVVPVEGPLVLEPIAAQNKSDRRVSAYGVAVMKKGSHLSVLISILKVIVPIQ